MGLLSFFYYLERKMKLKKEMRYLPYYEVTPCTMAIIHQFDEETREPISLVLEEDIEYVVPLSPNKIVDDACKFFGSDLKGRLDWTRDVCGLHYKLPIAISHENKMYFFPTASPKKSHCSWIAHSFIKRISKFSPHQTEVTFMNGRSYIFDISYGSMLNQMKRTALLRYLLDHHLKSINGREKVEMIAEPSPSFPLQ